MQQQQILTPPCIGEKRDMDSPQGSSTLHTCKTTNQNDCTYCHQSSCCPLLGQHIRTCVHANTWIVYMLLVLMLFAAFITHLHAGITCGMYSTTICVLGLSVHWIISFTCAYYFYVRHYLIMRASFLLAKSDPIERTSTLHITDDQQDDTTRTKDVLLCPSNTTYETDDDAYHVEQHEDATTQHLAVDAEHNQDDEQIYYTHDHLYSCYVWIIAAICCAAVLIPLMIGSGLDRGLCRFTTILWITRLLICSIGIGLIFAASWLLFCNGQVLLQCVCAYLMQYYRQYDPRIFVPLLFKSCFYRCNVPCLHRLWRPQHLRCHASISLCDNSETESRIHVEKQDSIHTERNANMDTLSSLTLGNPSSSSLSVQLLSHGTRDGIIPGTPQDGPTTQNVIDDVSRCLIGKDVSDHHHHPTTVDVKLCEVILPPCVALGQHNDTMSQTCHDSTTDMIPLLWKQDNVAQ